MDAPSSTTIIWTKPQKTICADKYNENKHSEMRYPTIFLELSVPTSKVVCLKKELLPLHIQNENWGKSTDIILDCTAKQNFTMVEACNSYLLNISFTAWVHPFVSSSCVSVVLSLDLVTLFLVVQRMYEFKPLFHNLKFILYRLISMTLLSFL